MGRDLPPRFSWWFTTPDPVSGLAPQVDLIAEISSHHCPLDPSGIGRSSRRLEPGGKKRLNPQGSRGYAWVPNPSSAPQSPTKRGVGLGRALGLYVDAAGELGLLDSSHQFGYCEGLITMRVQFANAEVRHEGATILTSLYPELAYITRRALALLASSWCRLRYAICLYLSEQ